MTICNCFKFKITISVCWYLVSFQIWWVNMWMSLLLLQGGGAAPPISKMAGRLREARTAVGRAACPRPTTTRRTPSCTWWSSGFTTRRVAREYEPTLSKLLSVANNKSIQKTFRFEPYTASERDRELPTYRSQDFRTTDLLIKTICHKRSPLKYRTVNYEAI